MHDLLAVSEETYLGQEWVLSGDPFVAHNSPSNASTAPCVYCSELHRIQRIGNRCNTQHHTLRRIWGLIKPKGMVARVTLESVELDTQAMAAFQAMQMPEEGAVRFGIVSTSDRYFLIHH